MTDWERLRALIEGLWQAANDESLDADEFTEACMDNLQQAVDILGGMGPVVVEQPHVWRIDVGEPSGPTYCVGTGEEARAFWYVRRGLSNRLGNMVAYLPASEAQLERHRADGPFLLEKAP
jgi:hypothetical protein